MQGKKQCVCVLGVWGGGAPRPQPLKAGRTHSWFGWGQACALWVPFDRSRWISSGVVIGYPVPMLCVTCQNVSRIFEHSSACPQPNVLTGRPYPTQNLGERAVSPWSSNACFLTEVDRFRNGALFASPAWDLTPSCSEPSLQALLGQRHGRPWWWPRS